MENNLFVISPVQTPIKQIKRKKKKKIQQKTRNPCSTSRKGNRTAEREEILQIREREGGREKRRGWEEQKTQSQNSQYPTKVELDF